MTGRKNSFENSIEYHNHYR
uniref:Uncharacterized protein n=1 Tax=Heterorhabditis bacteriophora TaxID=37862 RepID=A0A1I7X242_HETBA